MTRGKSICSVLKTIRKQIADTNEIKYEPRECHYEGECRGTCPACEAEVRYIERELDIRRQLGKAEGSWGQALDPLMYKKGRETPLLKQII